MIRNSDHRALTHPNIEQRRCLEAEVPARYVFADTGWEAEETYRYLDMLRRRLAIPIDVVRAEPKLPTSAVGGMVDRIRGRSGFPARMQRWCTRELKLEPLRTYHDAIIERSLYEVDTVCVMGVRAEESLRRAQMSEWEDDPQWGGWLWRPIRDALDVARSGLTSGSCVGGTSEGDRDALDVARRTIHRGRQTVEAMSEGHRDALDVARTARCTRPAPGLHGGGASEGHRDALDVASWSSCGLPLLFVSRSEGHRDALDVARPASS